MRGISLGKKFCLGEFILFFDLFDKGNVLENGTMSVLRWIRGNNYRF